MIIFTIFTIFSVSIDSFFCGLSLTFYKEKKIFADIIMSIVVFAMCLIANLTAELLSQFLNEKISNLSGIILIIIGIVNLIKKDNNNFKNNNNYIIESIFLGLAIGTDGAFATLSLSILGNTSLLIPMFMSLTHFILMFLGILLSKLKIVQKFGNVSFIPPLILIILGGYKLLKFFI